MALAGTPKRSQSSHCTHVDALTAPPWPLQFSTKVTDLLSHSYHVSVVYLAPCGRKCAVSLMVSSTDPSIYPVVLQAWGASFVCPVRQSEWSSQDTHAVKFHLYV